MRLKDLLMLFMLKGDLFIEIGSESFDGKLYQNSKRYENYFVKSIEIDEAGNTKIKVSKKR